MDEKRLLEMLKASGEDLKIPENLEPEQVEKWLEGSILDKKKKAGRPVRRYGALLVVAAAAVVIFGSVFRFGLGNFAGASGMSGGVSDGTETAAGSIREENADEAVIGNEGEVPEAAEEAAAEFQKLFHQASDLSEVEKQIADYEKEQKKLMEACDSRSWLERIADDIFGAKTSGNSTGVAEEGSMESAAPTDTTEMVSTDAADTGAASAGSGGESGYSSTNVQTEGVDEGDIVKTDGEYLYIVRNSSILLYDIREAKPKRISEITDEGITANSVLQEMYVDGDTLQLIIETVDTYMEDKDGEENVYYVRDAVRTHLITYDISNRENPVRKGDTAVDGSYQTSRKVGKHVYLVTDYYVQREEKSGKILLPAVNDSAIAADCVYLPEQMNNTHCVVIASVDADHPGETKDQKTIFTDGFGDPYVSKTAIYLKATEYKDVTRTRLIQFRFRNGTITPGGAASVIGDIRDTFAINEYNNTLRVLTTAWVDTDNQNYVTVFQANTMKMESRIEGIAKGEQIYSARFLGDMGYFVTYRNTDPLFAVDFSDPEKPQILDELKVTGFSEYLHFWGEDKLLGIGYETDPDSGEQLGVKLSMFDISDPGNIEEKSRLVLENTVYTCAEYVYKSVLIDPARDLIGFTAVTDWRDCAVKYLLFSYNESGEFKRMLTENLETNDEGQNIRGLYAGNYLYIVSGEQILTYDMENGYTLISKESF